MNQTSLHFLAGIGALALVLTAGYGVHALRACAKRRRAARKRIEYLTPRLIAENARRDKTVRLAPLAKSELPPGYWPTPKTKEPAHPNIY